MLRLRTLLIALSGICLVVTMVAFGSAARDHASAAQLIPTIVTNSAAGCQIQRSAPAPTVAASRTRANAPGCMIPPNAAAPAPNPSELGVPAIRPHAGITAPDTPAFTAQDVQQYIAKNPLNGKIGAIGATNIVKIDFMTAQAVDTMLNTTTAPLPPDRLMCVVELSGSFFASGPPRPNASVKAYKTAYLVFDAHTGNEVLETAQ